METLSNVSYVINQIFSNLNSDEFNLLFDPDLTYQSSLRHLKRHRIGKDINLNDHNVFPLLVWNRMPLKVDETLGRRKGQPSIRGVLEDGINENNEKQEYNSFLGELEIVFKYFTNTMRDLETFELLYLSRNNFSNIRELEIDYTSVDSIIGVQEYSLDWGEFTSELKDDIDEDFYLSLDFKCTVKGNFFVVTDNFYPVILEINTKLFTNDHLINIQTISA